MLSPGRTELWAATFLASLLLEVAASPSHYAGFQLDDVRRPVYRGNTRTRDLKADTEVIVKSDISVAGAEDGRAVSSAPASMTTPTPMAESLKMVTKQLLQAPSATDMVATDVRTPPKVKSQVKTQESNADFVPLGKGEAQPVAIEDPSGYEIITAPPVKQSTPQTEGLSTWILLSNGEQSTLATNKKKVAHTTDDPKKVHKPTMATPTIEKVRKPEDVKSKPTHNKPIALALRKQSNETKDKEDTPNKTSIILQDPKFKNKTPTIVGKVPSTQNKTDTPTKKIASHSTTASIITRKRPISLSPTPPTYQRHDLVPTTSLLLEASTIDSSDDIATTETNPDKSTRRPTTTKKKKKNKNRRRRPTKEGETAESKVEETSVSPLGTKINSNTRPISTTIYNYLAREVMPSVGVGLVGLVLTAGLAGLFFYPFGGAIARRNYEKGPHTDHQYYYNSYAPHPERDHQTNWPPEENAFGEVLSGNNFVPSKYEKYDETNKYRYDLPEFSPKDNDYNVNGYAGTSDYSTLPDSVKNPDYKSEYSSKVASFTKGSDYSKAPDYALKPSDYTKADYSVHDHKPSEYSLPEASKYYSMDPVSSHYKLTDGTPQVDTFKPEDQYPSLTEYASYTSAAAIGTQDTYGVAETEETKNNTVPIGEDKSDKSQPHFSALVGSPQFTNTDFVGSMSLSSGYGAHDDMRHRTGVLAAEHGPRSLKLEEDKDKKVVRRRRDVHDDFSNEIDGGDDKFYNKPSESPLVTTEDSLSSTTSPLSVDTTTSGASKDYGLTTPGTETNSETTTQQADGNTSDTGSNEKDSLTTDEPPMPVHSSGGFLDFLARLAHMKLKIGLSILKTTGETVTKYLDIVSKRMEEAVRTMEKRRRSAEQKRQRRDVTAKRTKKDPEITKKPKSKSHFKTQ